MRARSIWLVFFFQGAIIGAAGTLAGTLIGLAASLFVGKTNLITLDPSVYFIDHLPISTVPSDVLFIVLAGFTIAALATIYPARRAAILYPVEAIRHE